MLLVSESDLHRSSVSVRNLPEAFGGGQRFVNSIFPEAVLAASEEVSGEGFRSLRYAAPKTSLTVRGFTVAVSSWFLRSFYDPQSLISQ